jgi:hypothetical protein
VRQDDSVDEISDRSKRSAVLSDEDVQRQRDQQRRSEEYYAAGNVFVIINSLWAIVKNVKTKIAIQTLTDRWWDK